MRGLVVDRRAVAILSRSQYLQRLSFSAGRGRGRGDVADAAPVGDSAPGVGLGLGNLGIGRGRGRGSAALPSPPPAAAPFKPFTLRSTTQERAPVVAAAPDSRFEDAPDAAEKDVKPAQSESRPLSGARPGFSAARAGAGRGVPVRQPASNADRARATAWGSLSQLLAGPPKPAAPRAAELPKHTEPVEPEVVEEKAPEPVSAVATETHQTASAAVAEPESPVSDASYVAMIKYHHAAGRFAEVDQIYGEMQADSVPISIPTYNLLIQIFSQAGQFDKMDKVYNQMRQTLTQVKAAPVKEEQAPVVSEPAPAPDVPVTLKEHVVVKSEDAPVTLSDDMSTKLGEWDDVAIQPPPAKVEEDVALPSFKLSPPESLAHDEDAALPSFKLSTPESRSPADDGHGKAFAQDIEESKRLMSFRGLLNMPALPDGTPQKGAFNPFNLPSTPSPSIFGGAAGRGRGQGDMRTSRAPIGADVAEATPPAVHAQPRTKEEREQARARAMALLAKGEQQQQGTSPPRAAQPQLSREDAVQRAVAVMKEGVERNLSREEERRRRRGAVDTLSDATTMVADRFRRRAPDSAAQQARGPQTAKDRMKRQPRFTPRRGDQEEEPQVPLTLREMTEEDEKRLIILEEEEQFQSSLHSKFLVDFEPEYAMEYFGLNPDIDELPQKSLEDILAEAKPYLMAEGVTDEQWDGEVKDVLEKVPHLENLVNLYAGGATRFTATEQSSKLHAVADTMPAHVAPEIQDFMSQAMLSLHSNPGIRMKEKERLMNKFVSSLSSF